MAGYESFYPGSKDYFVPVYGSSIGYSVNTGDFTLAMDPRTANQIREVNSKLNTGAKGIEVQGLSAKTWDSIPDEHLVEINRLSKLTGMKPSLHGPLVEPSGVGEKGWNEMDRESAERQIAAAIKRANKLDPNGNILVTFHSSAQLPEMRPTIKQGKEEKVKTMWVVNPTTGKFGAIETKKTFLSDKGEFTGEAIETSPEDQLEKLNRDAWTEQLTGINFNAVRAEQAIDALYKKRIAPDVSVDKSPEEIQRINNLLKQAKDFDISKLNPDDPIKEEIREKQEIANQGQIYLREAYRNMRSLFDEVYAKSSGEDKEKLNKFAEWASPMIKGGLERDPEKIRQLNEIIRTGLQTLNSINHPNMFIPLNEFALDQSSQTFANAATKAYEQFGVKAPIITIENPPAGGGLSRAEDLRQLIERTRDKLAQNLQDKRGLGKSEAKEVAERLIGATWDVGHINMIKGFGYEDKDVIAETEKIAPFVNKIHLSDNFGYEHTELPMGMGNVPIKQMLSKIEKGAPERAIKKVIEAGDWFQHFAERGGGHPLVPSMENFASPLYSTAGGPTWNALGGYPSYYMGHGTINPPIHHSVYGAGFTTLPVELGGEMAGGASRFSGTPNQ